MNATILPYMGPVKTGTEAYPTAEYKLEQASIRRLAESTPYDPLTIMIIKEEIRAMALKDEPLHFRRSKV